MEFRFTVYAKRWHSTRTYRVSRIDSGWHIDHIAINGDCDKEGRPFFISNLNQDQIRYPHDFGSFLEFIWNQAEEGEIEDEEVQEKLQQVADWISACEREQPMWREWNCDSQDQPMD